MNWKTQETAPRDGSYILVLFKHPEKDAVYEEPWIVQWLDGCWDPGTGELTFGPDNSFFWCEIPPYPLPACKYD